MSKIRLDDIPRNLLPVITSTPKHRIWLNGLIVKEIFIWRETTYRIITNNGEYRYSLDTDLVLDIT